MVSTSTRVSPGGSPVQEPEGATILVVEDEKKLAQFIKRTLAATCYTVDLAFDGAQALQKIAAGGYRLIVLDINLPRVSGVEVLEDIRGHRNNLPVLVLSGRVSVEDRVRALQAGADDYLVKPFDSSELIARIEAILRRTVRGGPTTLTAADISLDLLQRTVVRAGKTISLTPREFSLLELFLRNKNQILTRKRIAQQVWGYTFETGTNVVDVYVSYLRKAIDEGFSRKLIHTVHGQGFILRDE